MKRDIRLIALDLDSTLLTSDKELADRDRNALERAASAGIEIVPATGRFYGMMPSVIRDLPFINYAITINGACVYDIRNDSVISAEEMPVPLALKIMTYLDGFDVIYDCYKDSRGWMTRALWEKSGEYARIEHFRRLLKSARQPVDDLKSFIESEGGGVQKISIYAKDLSLRARLMKDLAERYPEIAVTSSVVDNIELNIMSANKGQALEHLCSYLGFGTEKSMAFGDGLNDVTMIRTAGIGVAMANSAPEVLEVADHVTADNDSCGVARALEELLFC